MAIALAGTMAVSCSDEKTTTYEVITPATPAEKPEPVMVTAATAFIGSNSDAELAERFTNITEAAKAKVIVVDCNDLDAYTEDIIKAYKSNVLIIVDNPDIKALNNWCAANGIVMSQSLDQKMRICGFDQRGNSYYMDIIRISTSLDDEDVPLNPFATWVNKVTNTRMHSTNPNATDLSKRFTPQTITYTYNFSLSDLDLAKVGWVFPFALNTTTTADAIYTIYPIHNFSTNRDIYIIETETTIHNAPMLNGIWKGIRDGKETLYSAFFMKGCGLQVGVSDGGATFLAGPMPDAMSAPGEYQSGFDWQLDGIIAGGVPDAKSTHLVAADGHWTWNNSATHELPDMNIRLSHDMRNRAYYLIGIDDAIDLSDPDVKLPETTTGDFTFYGSFIYESEPADEMQLAAIVTAVYGGETIAGGKRNITQIAADNCALFNLITPSHVPTGYVTITNRSQYTYITDIVFIDSTGEKTELPATIIAPGATAPGLSATRLNLPAGPCTVTATGYNLDENEERIDVTNLNFTIEVILGGDTNLTFAN